MNAPGTAGPGIATGIPIGNTLQDRLSALLLARPHSAVLPALFAGAAAAYDPSLRPRFDLLLLLMALFVLLVDVEGGLLHPAVPPGSGDVPGAEARRRARRLRIAAALALAAVLGTILVVLRGWPMFWFVTAAALLSLSFAAGPRLADTGLGGPVTLFRLGPLASAGAAFALVGHVAPPAFWIGVPLGFLADAGRRARAAAREPGGAPPAPPWFAGDLVAAFGSVPALVLGGGLPFVALASWLSLPLATGELARSRRGAAAWSWPAAAARMRILLAVFAVLLAAATFAARVLATRAT